MRTGLWKTLLFLAMAAAMLAAPSSALALRYASPSGVSTNDCQTPETACDLATAIVGDGIANFPSVGEEVIVEPGSYTNNAVITEPLGSQLFIHGDFAGQRPVINEPTTGQLQFSSGTVSYLDFESGTSNAVNMGGGTMERVFMKGASSGNLVCQCPKGTIRDSVIISTGSIGALGVVSNGGTAGGSYRNVTAIATDPGAQAILIQQGTANPLNVDAYNVIASNTAGGTDVEALGNGAQLTFHHSNYARATQVSSGVVQDAPGDPHQSAPPLFTNAGAFDFTEALGSPTIDAGLTDPLNGDLDFAGDARTIGAGTDIGAFEFNPTTPSAGGPAVPPGSPPSAIKPKCKQKKSKAQSAKKHKKCGKKKKKGS